MSIAKIQNTTTCKSPIDSIYYVGLIFALLYLLSFQVYWEFPGFVSASFKWLAFLLVSVRLFFFVIQKLSTKEFICFVLLLGLSVLVGHRADMTYRLYMTFALIFGAKGLYLKKILKYYVITGIGFCLATFIGYQLGWVKDFSTYNYLSDFRLMSVGYRNSFGYISPTDFANHVIYIFLAYFFYKGGLFKKRDYIVLLFVILYVAYYSDARLMLGCCSLLILSSFFCRNFHDGKWLLIQKYKMLLLLAICIIPIFVFYIVNDYNSGSSVWQLLNLYTSGRLTLSADAMKYVGPSWFGQYYEMIGVAAADTLRGREEYNYIDSSFIQLVVIYGIVYTVVLLYAFVYLAIKNAKRNDFVIPIIIFVAFIEGMFAQHLMLIEFNPILFALFAKNNIVKTDIK